MLLVNTSVICRRLILQRERLCDRWYQH